MEIRSPVSAADSRQINASRNGDERREQRESELARLASRRAARDEARARDAERQRQAEQAERRFQGRLVTDARREPAPEADHASRARAMRERVRNTYREQRADAIRASLAQQQEKQAEIRRQQADQTRHHNPIDLVV